MTIGQTHQSPPWTRMRRTVLKYPGDRRPRSRSWFTCMTGWSSPRTTHSRYLSRLVAGNAAPAEVRPVFAAQGRRTSASSASSKMQKALSLPRHRGNHRLADPPVRVVPDLVPQDLPWMRNRQPQRQYLRRGHICSKTCAPSLGPLCSLQTLRALINYSMWRSWTQSSRAPRTTVSMPLRESSGTVSHPYQNGKPGTVFLALDPCEDMIWEMMRTIVV